MIVRFCSSARRNLFTAASAFSAFAFPSILGAQEALGVADMPEDPQIMAAADDYRRYLDIFTPFETESAALSPDGQHVAYSRRVGEDLFISIIAVDDPSKAVKHIHAGTARGATETLQRRSLESTPAKIDWMGWPTDKRLVFQVNLVERTNVFTSEEAGSAPIDPNDDPLEQLQTRGVIFGYTVGENDGDLLLTPNQIGVTEERTVSGPPRLPGADTAGGAIPTAESSVLADIGMTPFESQTPTPPPVRPRSPHILDYSPENPNEIWVRAGPVSNYNLHAVDVFTGRKRIVLTEVVTPGKTVLLNRQGRAGAVVNSTLRSPMPHRFEVASGRTFSRWQEINILLADPSSADFSLTGSTAFGNRSFPLGFDEDPNILYYASDVGRDKMGVFALHLPSGKQTDLSVEHPEFDLALAQFHGFDNQSNLVYDRYRRSLKGIRFHTQNRQSTAWLDDQWRALQSALEQALPEQNVEILEWSRDQERFLIRTSSPTDAGGFYVFDLGAGRLLEMARADPTLDATPTAISADFTFRASNNRPMTGRVLIPAKPIAQPIPLIVLTREEPWQRLDTDFDREAMALARMGYVVARINGRGAWGFGKEHRRSIFPGYEVAQARDLISLVDFLEKNLAIDPTKVAVMGRGLGGYVALRAVQLHPEHFRGAITIDAPFSLRQWLEEIRWDRTDRGLLRAGAIQLVAPYLGTADSLTRSPLVDSPETINRPVQLFAFRSEDGDLSTAAYNHAFVLNRTLRGLNIPTDLIDLHPDYLRGLPNAHARVMADIAAFLDTHLFRYEVTLGELEFEGVEGDE